MTDLIIKSRENEVSAPENTKLPDVGSIHPKSETDLCKLTFTKGKNGLWKIDVTDYMLTPRDRNEIMRQLKLWYRRYSRLNTLENAKRRREASEKVETTDA